MTKKSKIFLIILLVGIALAGLIAVQIYWVAMTYRLSEKEFNANAMDALRKATEEVNSKMISYETFSKVHLKVHEGFYLLKNSWKNDTFLDPSISRPDTIPILYDNPEYPNLFRWNSLKFTSAVNISMIFQYEYPSLDNSRPDTLVNTFEKANVKNFREAFSEGKPIEERYDPGIFDSLLQKNLRLYTIHEDFDFGFINIEKNKVDYLHNGHDTAAIINSRLKTRLTPSVYFSKPFDVSLSFKSYTGRILYGISKLLTLSVIIVLILLVSFFLFVRIILRQRKFSELKTDFINNMTHEFKTPLTNISLAVETMTEQKFERGEKEEGVLRIIGQEAERLRENIDRILQIARFEKEQLHLSVDSIDLHQLITKVVSVFDSFSGKKETILRCHFTSVSLILEIDETHFFNLIYNIVDNAIKYNLSAVPEIVISTKSLATGAVITIKDNGIGIPATEQKSIFQKFYRVQRGNLHDVKGYGLGLSYVKLIVEAHHGQIKVSSHHGQGSEFEIFIPKKRNGKTAL